MRLSSLSNLGKMSSRVSSTDFLPRPAVLSAVALLLCSIACPANAVTCTQAGAGSGLTPDDNGNLNSTACGASAGAGTSPATNTNNSNFGFASGNNAAGSHNSAFGSISGQSVTGDQNSAFGSGAGEDVKGSGNIAVGYHAGRAIGTIATPITGTVAIGSDGADGDDDGAIANANNAMAIGTDARSNGVSSMALGAGASTGATHANSVAFGAGAATTRADQQAFGTATTTYTMAGINSGSSTGAQTGPVTALNIVTSDAAGNLAGRSASSLGLASAGEVASLQSGVAGLQSQINNLGKRDDELADGIAIAVALAQPIFQSGQTFAIRAGWGNFDGSNAVGVSAAGIVGRFGASTVVLDGGIGSSTDTVAGRAGLTLGW